MANLQVNLNDTTYHWREVTNQLIDGVGDISLLATKVKTDVVLSINEIVSTNIGDVSELSTGTNAVESINDIYDTISSSDNLNMDLIIGLT